MNQFVIASASALLIGTGGLALGQESTGQGSASAGQNAQDGSTVDVVPYRTLALNNWDYEELYREGTWTAEQLFDAEVFGSENEEIGEVENIVIGTGGTVEALIVEVGGFWDIGDTHVSVPWSEVDVSFDEGEPRVQVPVTEDTVDDYDVFGGVGGEFRVVDDDEPYTPRGWRATELIDDYVTLEDGRRYGWVDDLIFAKNGRLNAVVVDAVYGGYGSYAYPYYGYGYGFRPGYNYYALPYSEIDIKDLAPFDGSRFENGSTDEG